jgi:dCMP deaminase
MMTLSRPDWDSYFMEFAKLAESRSTCRRRRVGAVVVKDRMILATGYTGAPKGVRHCTEIGCLRQQMKVPSGQRHELCRGLHAEQNAIVQAAFHGVSIRGGTMYCTFRPCVICVKMIINAGLKRVLYLGHYQDELVQAMVDDAGLEMVQAGEAADDPGGAS